MVSKLGKKRKYGEKITMQNGKVTDRKLKLLDVTQHIICPMKKEDVQKLMEPSQDSSKYLTGMRESSNIRTALKPILLSRTHNQNPNLITKIITRMEMIKL